MIDIEGYIKIYRSIQENPIWQQKPFSKGQAWVDMMLRCNHVCKPINGYGSLKWVKRGEFVSSNYKLAEAWGWSESAVRLFMRQLEYNKMILRQSFGKFSLYFLQNYAHFQSTETEDLSQFTNAQNAHRKRTRCAQKTPNNNDNNVNNDKKKKILYSSEHIRMAEKLKSLILQNNPGAKTPDDLSKWATVFEQMERLDKRTPEQINTVMEFSQKDLFWKANVLSAKKLREQFDKLWLQKDRAKPQQSGPANKGNFEQRKYSDGDIDKMYKDD